ncbi:hypothetical protein C8R45DRAFT_1027599 [Mycena sanguinolenta]|nr:hypothetical protein C8R45DRAFT_1027599 [Mycena sanguinolenta]
MRDRASTSIREAPRIPFLPLVLILTTTPSMGLCRRPSLFPRSCSRTRHPRRLRHAAARHDILLKHEPIARGVGYFAYGAGKGFRFTRRAGAGSMAAGSRMHRRGWTKGHHWSVGELGSRA